MIELSLFPHSLSFGVCFLWLVVCFVEWVKDRSRISYKHTIYLLRMGYGTNVSEEAHLSCGVVFISFRVTIDLKCVCFEIVGFVVFFFFSLCFCLSILSPSNCLSVIFSVHYKYGQCFCDRMQWINRYWQVFSVYCGIKNAL